MKLRYKILLLSFLISYSQTSWGQYPNSKKTYKTYVQECVEQLMEYGTDRYGDIHAPILVSILDIDSLKCPLNPKKIDEYYRVTRRDRRNPSGANLITDQPVLKTMKYLSRSTGDKKYADFARNYETYYLKNLIDEKGFIWWGWHRHYDVYKDILDGHNGNHHEIHALQNIDWESLWNIDQTIVTNEITAIWEWHVIDKNIGEINRHGDGRRGCDFSMSAGSFIEAFIFMFVKTRKPIWMERCNLLVDYYWDRRNPDTNLFPERPNAGTDRFDGSTFVTSITGLHCFSLLNAYEMTREPKFLNYALSYLKAYNRHGYDEESGKYWGALNLDGTPIPGPRIYTDNIDSSEGYLASQPRGHLDLWEPYVAGYQYAIYTAQAYIYAYELSGDPDLLVAAKRFAAWISKTPIGEIETENTWYKNYSMNQGLEGTYAGKYGRAISFFIHLFALTGDQGYLLNAQNMADTAIGKLYKNGLFRGHPSKPYYESIDGVGYLLYALLELDHVINDPNEVIVNKGIFLNEGKIPMDNW